MPIYRYFSPVPGHAAARYGTGTFIGAHKTPTGFEWDEGAVVPIPILEIRANLKAYNGLLRKGPRLGPSLVERTRADYEAYAATRGFDPVPDDVPRTAKPAMPVMAGGHDGVAVGKEKSASRKKASKESTSAVIPEHGSGRGGDYR